MAPSPSSTLTAAMLAAAAVLPCHGRRDKIGVSRGGSLAPSMNQVAHALRFLDQIQPINDDALAYMSSNEQQTFKEDDLRPPIINGAEAALADLNLQLLDYAGNWDIRQHDSVITECEHSPDRYSSRVYYDHHLDGEWNPAQAHLDEWRCPVQCFKQSRKLLHNSIFTEIMGEPLHAGCSKEHCPPDASCGTNATDTIKDGLKICSNSPKLVLLTGVPASGKDKLLREMATDIVGGGYKSADPDEIKMLLAKKGSDPYARLVQSIQGETRRTDRRKLVQESYDITQILAQYIHRESIVLSYELMQKYMSECHSFVLQKTGTRWDGEGGIKHVIQKAKALGYEVHSLMAHAHPYSIWLNQLNRVKHFRSSGRAMHVRQVLGDSTYFPKATKEMLRDILKGKVQLDSIRMMVYSTMEDLVGGKHTAIDAFQQGVKKEALKSIWNVWGDGKRDITAELVAKRAEYAADLQVVM